MDPIIYWIKSALVYLLVKINEQGKELINVLAPNLVKFINLVIWSPSKKFSSYKKWIIKKLGYRKDVNQPKVSSFVTLLN